MTDLELFTGFDDYQKGRGLVGVTRNRRRATLANFSLFMAPASITAAKPADIDRWMGRLDSAGTRWAYYRDLVAFFRWAHRRDLVTNNVMILTPTRLGRPSTCRNRRGWT